MLDEYLRAARKTRVSERVIFTGYLTHRELRYLLPCCDVALIPSLVAEAGPLVFLEALAAGVFPIGVYAAGLAASIDALGGMLPPAVLELMKLRGEPEHLVPDIVSHVPGALRLGRVHATRLRRAVVESHDLDTVGGTILDLLRDLARR
jgi:glycosyltransferase involved in cell wall biosynthesis